MRRSPGPDCSIDGLESIDDEGDGVMVYDPRSTGLGQAQKGRVIIENLLQSIGSLARRSSGQNGCNAGVRVWIVDVSHDDKSSRHRLKFVLAQDPQAKLAERRTVLPQQLRHVLVRAWLDVPHAFAEASLSQTNKGARIDHRDGRFRPSEKQLGDRLDGDFGALYRVQPHPKEDVPFCGTGGRKLFHIDRIRQEDGVGPKAFGVTGEVRRRVDHGLGSLQERSDVAAPRGVRVESADVGSVAVHDPRTCSEGPDQRLRRVMDMEQIDPAGRDLCHDCGHRREAKRCGREFPWKWQSRTGFGRLEYQRAHTASMLLHRERAGNRRDVVYMRDGER